MRLEPFQSPALTHDYRVACWRSSECNCSDVSVGFGLDDCHILIMCSTWLKTWPHRFELSSVLRSRLEVFEMDPCRVPSRRLDLARFGRLPMFYVQFIPNSIISTILFVSEYLTIEFLTGGFPYSYSHRSGPRSALNNGSAAVSLQLMIQA